MSAALDLLTRYRGAVSAAGIVLRSLAAGIDAASIRIESGTGAPTHASVQGSFYIRTDATDSGTWLYRNTDGGTTWEAALDTEATELLAAANTWTLLQTFAAGIAADTIAERSAGVGVTIDGAKVLDGHILDSVGFYDAAAPTKIARVDVGAVTAGQTRVISAPDANVDLADIATHTTQIAALGAENADVVIPCTMASFSGVSGVWTRSRTAAGIYRLRRTAGAAVEVVEIEVPVARLRSTAGKGLKVTGLKLQYQIAVADPVDVTVAGILTVMPATGAAVAAAGSLGAVTYDAAHDTAAERKAVGQHTMQATFGSPAYLGDGFITIQITVDSTGIATAAVDFYLLELLCSETTVDLA